MTTKLSEPVYEETADKKIKVKKNVSQERNVDKNNGGGELKRIVLTENMSRTRSEKDVLSGRMPQNQANSSLMIKQLHNWIRERSAIEKKNRISENLCVKISEIMLPG